MATLKSLKADSWRGRKAVDRWLRRGEDVLDRRSLRQAGKIVDAVRRGGDRALVRMARRWDGVQARTIEHLRLRTGWSEDQRSELPAGYEAALERAIGAVERYHREQVREGFTLAEDGIELVERRIPLRRVGVYVPGGRASYPSTVLMTVIPARLAGVEEIAVATPPGSWHASPALRYALERLEVREVWGLGGAHAVAAFAYGTESVARVDKVVGPGNRWVTAAKHLVSAAVGIESLAGPSEVVIVATDEADPAWVAADLLAQAEHDPQARALLVTDSARLARAVAREVDHQLRRLETAPVARAALARHGLALRVGGMDEALELVEALAPEHLQLVGAEAEALAERVRTAGATFVGAHTPEVFGDYLAGPSHVLPTGGTARFASALGVDDFVRRGHQLRFEPEAAVRASVAAATLAEVEGLPAHAAAARKRFAQEPRP